MHLTKRTRILFLVVVVSPLAVVACGIAVKRDLSATPAGQVGFDDMCGLQDYFDSLEAKVSRPPAVSSSLDLEGGGADGGQRTVRGGRQNIVFEGDFLMKNVRRVLNENWTRLPESLATAKKVEFEVRWAERAGVKRLVTDQDPEMVIDGSSSYLPYHVCLSELLFGAPLYKQRQLLWGLPNPSAKIPLDLGLDGGAADASSTVIRATPDGGAPAGSAPTPTAPAK
jgi:hypothetical protein